MKYEELNKIVNNKSEEKAFYKKNLENINYRIIQTEMNEKAYDNFATDYITKSCAMPKTTKNKTSNNNLENFDSISPINSKNLNEIKPNKLNYNYENSSNNQAKSSNQNHVQGKFQDGNIYNNDKSNSKPILIIDVKLKEGNMSHIKVYEGDTAEKLSNNFANVNGNFFKSNRFLIPKFKF